MPSQRYSQVILHYYEIKQLQRHTHRKYQPNKKAIQSIKLKSATNDKQQTWGSHD
jgi:hypothetical protein